MNINSYFKREKNLPLLTGVMDSPPKGEFIAKPGERVEFVMTCTASIPLFEGYFVRVYRFVDDNGSVVVNFASKDGSWFTGEKYRIKATVKRHSVWEGVKQTQIIRLKTIELFYDKPVEETTSDASWNVI